MEGEYDCCPNCGENWSNNPEEHKCNKMILVEKAKPRYYLMDLDNYNEEFLKKIILWQDLKLRVLENPDKVEVHQILNF